MTKNAKYILEIINDSVNHLTAEQIYLLLKEKNKKVENQPKKEDKPTEE